MTVEIVPIDTPTLGDRSYLVHDGQVAVVIDPQRDIERVLAQAERLGVEIRHVFETHIHNDYVTGGFALAQTTGAAYHVNADDPVTFDRHPVTDGDVIVVSPTLSVRVLATPGHTFTHLSFALTADGRPVGVFTGGSLLYGSTGRPDLLGPDHTEALVRAQYRSVRRLAAELPESALVLPTHGFGSFCSATQSDGQSSTLGQEKRENPVLVDDEETFVRGLLAGLDAYPAYYAHMAPANLSGPSSPELAAPAPADAMEIRSRLDAGEWVVDLRTRQAFASGHLAGTLNFGLDGSFATYLGWLIPWGKPLTLLGETPEQVAEAQRELMRIGIDRIAGAAVGGPEDWAGEESPLRRLRVARYADLVLTQTDRDRADDIVVLDVRRDLEWAEGHVSGAVHIPLHDLLGRIHEIPEGQVWVHCQSGYRAAIAASLLSARGRDVVAVDDEFGTAPRVGVQTVRSSAASEVAA